MDPEQEGYDACDEGLSETDNPYDIEKEFDKYCAWNDGFDRYEEEN